MSNLPPIPPQCNICDHKPDDGVPLLRCSVCKDRFYCTTACQREDWQDHKHSCSVLPPDDRLEPTKVQDNDPDRKQAVLDYSSLLRQWITEHKKINEGNTVEGKTIYASPLKGSVTKALLDFPFPESLPYDRKPFEPEKFPYRLPLVLATRAGLIQHLSQIPPPKRGLIVKIIDVIRLNVPSAFSTPLFGPKILSRPESLAPREYQMLALFGETLFGSLKPDADFGLSSEDREFWVSLAFALKELWMIPKYTLEAAEIYETSGRIDRTLRLYAERS